MAEPPPIDQSLHAAAKEDARAAQELATEHQERATHAQGVASAFQISANQAQRTANVLQNTANVYQGRATTTQEGATEAQGEANVAAAVFAVSDLDRVHAQDERLRSCAEAIEVADKKLIEQALKTPIIPIA